MSAAVSARMTDAAEIVANVVSVEVMAEGPGVTRSPGQTAAPSVHRRQNSRPRRLKAMGFLCTFTRDLRDRRRCIFMLHHIANCFKAFHDPLEVLMSVSDTNR